MNGKIVPKRKFEAFVDIRSKNKKVNQAILSGKYFSLEDTKFIIKIYPDGSIDFDEIETNLTTPERRQQLLEIIEEKDLSVTKAGTIVTGLKFEDVESNRELALIVQQERPYAMLDILFDDDEVEPDISDDNKIKINKLFDLFEEDEAEAEDIQEEPVTTVESKEVNNDWLIATFDSLREEKREELTKNLKTAEDELIKLKIESSTLQSRITQKEKDIELINDRLKSIGGKRKSNGYYFHVSERQNEKVNLDADLEQKMRIELAKVKSINLDAFMKLFQIGEYHISIFDEKKNLVTLSSISESKEMVTELYKMKLNYFDNKFVYEGEMEWHDIVDAFINLGYQHLSVKPETSSI